jgi:hypothetical protein
MTQMIPGLMTKGPTMEREHHPELRVCRVQRSDLRELHFTLLPQRGESAAMMSERLAILLKTHNANVVRHEVFGDLAAGRNFATARRRLFG